MISVIAHIRFDVSKKAELIKIYEEMVPQVLDEDGCLEYHPHEDLITELPNQLKNEGRFLVIEKWESWKAFQDHLKAPHVIEFREKIKGIVTEVKVNVLKPLSL